jgi:hypothetical protein
MMKPLLIHFVNNKKVHLNQYIIEVHEVELIGQESASSLYFSSTNKLNLRGKGLLVAATWSPGRARALAKYVVS